MKIDFIDISRAYFQAEAIRRVYVELPEEDYSEGMCGLLQKSMYGTRDAAQNWGEAYSSFMRSIGFTQGTGSPCVFWHSTKELRVVVHGDDFTVLGWEEQLDWFWGKIKTKFLSKHRGRIGPAPGDKKEMRILNRIVEWTDQGICYEGDQRHVEICLKELKLGEESRTAATPSDRSTQLKTETKPLEPCGATQYRALTARTNYLGQDRSDIQFAVKELSKDMATPDEQSWIKLKRLVRYLKGYPRCQILFEYQQKAGEITAWSDSDFAGCEKSRKSTSAGLIMLGKHMIKSWSTNQAVVALSSGEAEYYALVKAASVAMGTRTLMGDLGISGLGPIEIKSDASAAIGIGTRVGIGKVRHIEVTQLWVQEKVAKKEIVLIKVKSEENLADMLTKPVDSSSINYHMTSTNSFRMDDRHPLAPQLDYMKGEGEGPTGTQG